MTLVPWEEDGLGAIGRSYLLFHYPHVLWKIILVELDRAGSGVLTGIAITGPHGEPMLLPVSRIRQELGERLGPMAPPMSEARAAIEQVYESAMHVSLQVVTAR